MNAGDIEIELEIREHNKMYNYNKTQASTSIQTIVSENIYSISVLS